MGLRTIIVALATGALVGCASPKAEANAERGHRIATLMGCTSCHGDKLDGHLFEENPQLAIAWSSNLSRILPKWSDAEIGATLRTGKRPDGTAMWFMPTFAQRHISDTDLRDLIAWLRTVPPSGDMHPPIKRGPQMEAAIKHDLFQDSAAQAQKLAARQPVDLGPKLAEGRYLTTIACSECHGPDLKGVRDPQPGDPPNLSTAAAYTPAAFARLVRTGVKQNGEKAVLMAEEAPKRLSVLSDAEIAAIQAYLTARARQ